MQVEESFDEEAITWRHWIFGKEIWKRCPIAQGPYSPSEGPWKVGEMGRKNNQNSTKASTGSCTWGGTTPWNGTGCRVSFTGDIQEQFGHNPVPCVLRDDPAWSGRLDQVTHCATSPILFRDSMFSIAWEWGQKKVTYR